jgi:serine/threonine protein kinase
MAFLYQGFKEKRIFHFDIKPDNILFLKGNFIVADFGTAYVINLI